MLAYNDLSNVKIKVSFVKRLFYERVKRFKSLVIVELDLQVTIKNLDDQHKISARKNLKFSFF